MLKINIILNFEKVKLNWFTLGISKYLKKKTGERKNFICAINFLVKLINSNG